jgi:Na+-driven multidrug efflux pump
MTAIFPTLVLQIYTDDMTIATAAIPSVYAICVATILLSSGMVYFEAVSGTGNTSAAMALEFGVLIAYVVYVFLMSKTGSIAAVWTAEWFYNAVMGLIAFFYIWKADWRKKVI